MVYNLQAQYFYSYFWALIRNCGSQLMFFPFYRLENVYK